MPDHVINGRGAFVHDLRHRFSYELRPDARLDASLRALAARLEADGLLAPGDSTAPRFHPHLTLCRAAVMSSQAVEALAEQVARDAPRVTLARAGTFGGGRIIYLVPAQRPALESARAALLDQLGHACVDPFAFSRPWVPHVTVAYAVPEQAQEAALRAVEAALPLAGHWTRAQSWDLDVRPTRLEHEAAIGD